MREKSEGDGLKKGIYMYMYMKSFDLSSLVDLAFYP